MTQLYALHIEGPDDIYAAPGRDEALKYAADLNAEFDKQEPHPYRPWIHAAVVLWTGTPDAHAETLDGHGWPPNDDDLPEAP